MLREVADRLELRGEALLDPSVDAVLAAARSDGWPETWLRSHGPRLAVEGTGARLHALGLRGVVIPIFSQSSRAHDLIAGSSGALVEALQIGRAHV